MPLNTSNLESAAQQAYDEYPENVRSGKFIEEFELLCEEELQSLGMPPDDVTVERPGNRQTINFEMERNKYVIGGYGRKELDVVVHSNSSGPLLAISLKSIMTSIRKNVNNRWEELVGDASNLHSRFPMLAFGFLLIVPTESQKDDSDEKVIGADGQPTELGRSIERKLKGVNGRSERTMLPSTYEQISLCVIDFQQDPPALHPDFPSQESNLRVDDFYDRLMADYNRRNPFIQ